MADRRRQVRVPFFDGLNITHVSSGLYHNLAINDAGVLWAWGDNTYTSTPPIACCTDTMQRNATKMMMARTPSTTNARRCNGKAARASCHRGRRRLY
jgi:alpha-tubulin suppressor-like RCC1 family protein